MFEMTFGEKLAWTMFTLHVLFTYRVEILSFLSELRSPSSVYQEYQALSKQLLRAEKQYEFDRLYNKILEFGRRHGGTYPADEYFTNLHNVYCKKAADFGMAFKQ